MLAYSCHCCFSAASCCSSLPNFRDLSLQTALPTSTRDCIRLTAALDFTFLRVLTFNASFSTAMRRAVAAWVAARSCTKSLARAYAYTYRVCIYTVFPNQCSTPSYVCVSAEPSQSCWPCPTVQPLAATDSPIIQEPPLRDIGVSDLGTPSVRLRDKPYSCEAARQNYSCAASNAANPGPVVNIKLSTHHPHLLTSSHLHLLTSSHLHLLASSPPHLLTLTSHP